MDGSGDTLTHRQEQMLRQLRTRHGRRKAEHCLVEGVRCCREMLALRPDLVEFAVCAASFAAAGELPGLTMVRVSDDAFRAWSSTLASQGVLLVARRPELPSATAPARPWLPILDRVADPGNVGTILRTVRAAGIAEVWLTSGAADPFGDKVIRAAMSAQFALAIREFRSLAEAVAEFRRCGGGTVYRTDCHGGESLYAVDELFAGSAIVFGSEAEGVGEVFGARAVTIPMPGGGESINVAQAATVFCAEFLRRTLAGGSPGLAGA